MSAGSRPTAIVVTFNSSDVICPTLDALSTQTLKPMRIVVVDNASSDGTVATVRRTHPEVEVLARRANDGYAAAVNEGARHARASQDADILVLTHECVLEAHAVDELVGALAAHPKAGAIGPLVRRQSGDEIWSAGGVVDRRTWLTSHLATLRHPSEPYVVDWLDGCALLIRGQAFDAVGGFSEAYFMYYEDVDFGVRLTRHGWASFVNPRAVAYQEPGRPGTRINARNHIELARQSSGMRTATRVLYSHARQVDRHAPLADPRWHGIVDFVLRRRSSLTDRVRGEG